MKAFFKKINTALGRAIESKWWSIVWVTYIALYLCYLGTRYDSYHENGIVWLWWVIYLLNVAIAAFYAFLAYLTGKRYKGGYHRGYIEGYLKALTVWQGVEDARRERREREALEHDDL